MFFAKNTKLQIVFSIMNTNIQNLSSAINKRRAVTMWQPIDDCFILKPDSSKICYKNVFIQN